MSAAAAATTTAAASGHAAVCLAGPSVDPAARPFAHGMSSLCAALPRSARPYTSSAVKEEHAERAEQPVWWEAFNDGVERLAYILADLLQQARAPAHAPLRHARQAEAFLAARGMEPVIEYLQARAGPPTGSLPPACQPARGMGPTRRRAAARAGPGTPRSAAAPRMPCQRGFTRRGAGALPPPTNGPACLCMTTCRLAPCHKWDPLKQGRTKTPPAPTLLYAVVRVPSPCTGPRQEHLPSRERLQPPRHGQPGAGGQPRGDGAPAARHPAEQRRTCPGGGCMPLGPVQQLGARAPHPSAWRLLPTPVQDAFGEAGVAACVQVLRSLPDAEELSMDPRPLRWSEGWG